MFVNNRPRTGSYERPLQLPPPSVLGNVTIVRSSVGGVNIPRVNILLSSQRSRQYFACSGVSAYRSVAGSKVVRDKGAGRSGNGCVGDVSSPGKSVCGT